MSDELIEQEQWEAKWDTVADIEIQLGRRFETKEWAGERLENRWARWIENTLSKR